MSLKHQALSLVSLVWSLFPPPAWQYLWGGAGGLGEFLTTRMGLCHLAAPKPSSPGAGGFRVSPGPSQAVPGARPRMGSSLVLPARRAVRCAGPAVLKSVHKSHCCFIYGASTPSACDSLPSARFRSPSRTLPLSPSKPQAGSCEDWGCQGG